MRTAARSTKRSAASLEPSTPSQQSQLARSAASAGAATMTSRILGLVRDQVLASMFGAGNAMDAFNVAFRIPNVVRDLFAEGAMTAAFVPVFIQQLASGERTAAWRLGNNAINALLVVTGILVVGGIAFARPLVTAFAADYAAVPGKLELTVLLTRIMLPFLTLVAIAAVFMGMLNSLHRFFVPALAPAMFNVATIICALLLVPLMPRFGVPPITAIAIGALVGGFGQLLIQWPLLRREGFAYRPFLDWKQDALRRVLLLMGPGTIGLAATQINVFVNTVLATHEGTGAVSWLNYAFRLMYLPTGLFGVSIATATVPAVSRQAAQHNDVAVRSTLADGLSLMLVLNVPATVGLIALSHPIVRVIFERRAFLPSDTLATAAALQYYAVGLLGYSIVRIAAPTFYALGDSRTPVQISVVAVLVNAALNVVLAELFGYRGLALGTSIAALFNAAGLLWLLRRRLDGLDDRRLLSSFSRIAMASMVMGAAALLIQQLLSQWIAGDAFLSQALRLALTIGFALVVLATTAHVLRIREFREAIALVLKRGGSGA
jgi:putative peptidoglycan lipid II flippase